MKIKKDTMPSQLRRVLLTINNPLIKGYTFDRMHELMTSMKPLTYYCISREIGGETGLEHFHLYAVFSSPVRFKRIVTLLPGAHIDRPNGTHSECRAYVAKEGKWAESEKGKTATGDFFEYGTLPPDGGKTKSTGTLDELHSLIVSGASDAEIYRYHPAYMRYASQIDRVRLAISQEQARSAPRDLTVTYIERHDGRGSQYAFDRHGYAETCRVLNYTRGPFDGYIENQHTALCFDFYDSSFDLPHLLAYSSPEPTELEARFHHKWAMYRYLYISSTLPLMSQHITEQADKPHLWQAFLSRISTVVVYDDDGAPTEYSIEEYRAHVATPPRFPAGFGSPGIGPPPAGQTVKGRGGGLSE